MCIKHATPTEVWGHVPPPTSPRKFRGYETAPETIFGAIQCFSEARQQSFTCMDITLSAHCFRLSDCSLISQATSFTDVLRLARLIVRLEEQKVVGRKTRKSSFALFAAISQVSTCHLCALGALHGHPLGNGTNSQRQGRYK